MATSLQPNKTEQPQQNKPQRHPQPQPSLEPKPAVSPLELQAALGNPRTARTETILRLQRTVGNRTTQHLIQRKATVGPAHDRYEQEADQVAQQALAMPAPAVPNQPLQRHEEELQAKPLASSITPLQRQEEEDELKAKPTSQRSGEGGFEVEQWLEASRDGGSPLPAEARAFMEPRFGADFSDVRIHTGGEAAQLSRDMQAQAFTHGSDIYFNEGKYNPGSDAGKQLLAHELTHTIQQGTGGTVQRRLAPHPNEASKVAHYKELSSTYTSLKNLVTEYNEIPLTDYRQRGNKLIELEKLVNTWLSNYASRGSYQKDKTLKEVFDYYKGLRLQELTKLQEERGKIVSAETFQERTAVGITQKRGTTLNYIDALIAQYHAIGPAKTISDDKLDQKIGIGLQIQEAMRLWFVGHQNDTSRESTKAALQKEKDTVDAELKDLENKKKAKDSTYSLPQVQETEVIKRLRARHEGPMDSALTKLSGMIDTLTPHNGDKAEVELEVKVPVGMGVFVGGKLKAEAEKDEGKVKVRMEAAILAGVDAVVAEFQLAIGGYFEAQAKSSTEAMNLVSYGMYRRLRESPITPNKVATFFWSNKRMTAQDWAKDIETRLLNDEDDQDAYVETGGLVRAGVSAGAGPVKLEGGAQFDWGKRYTAKSVKGKADTANKAIDSKVLNFSLDLDAGLLAGGASAQFRWLAGKYAETEFEIQGSVKLGGKTVANHLKEIIAYIAQKITEKEGEANQKSKGEKLGEVVKSGETLKAAGETFWGEREALETSLKASDETPTLFESSGSIDLVVTATKPANEGWEIAISVNATDEKALNVGVLAGKFKRTERVFGLKYSGGSWTKM